MSKIFEYIPYQRIGEFFYGAQRNKIKEVYGEPKSSQMYGYPEEDSYLDEYDGFHILCSKDEKLEAIDFLPFLSKEDIILRMGSYEVVLCREPNDLVENLSKLTDDLVVDDEACGYSSEKLGLKIYCPDEEVESVIVYERNYYDY